MRVQTIVTPLLFCAMGSFLTYHLTNSDSDVKLLTQENTEIKTELDILDQKYKNLQTSSRTASPTLDNQVIDTLAAQHQKEIEALNQQIAALQEKLKQKQPLVVNSNSAAFSQWNSTTKQKRSSTYDKIEAEFAYGTFYTDEEGKVAKSLTQTIEANPALSDFGFGDAECKKETCRVQVAASEKTQLSDLFTALNTEFSTNSEFANKSFLVVPDPSTGLTSVYVGSQDSNLLHY